MLVWPVIIWTIGDEILPIQNGQSYQTFIQYVTDRAGHDFRYAISTEKIKAQLNWVPKTSFENGLMKTIKYYCQLYNALKDNSRIGCLHAAQW